MSMSGDLSSVKLADVFQMLAMSQEPQVLSISSGKITKHFTFAANQIKVSLNTKKMGPIGQILVNLGKMTEEQLNETLMEQQGSGLRLGELVIRKGFATEHDVEAVFRMQMEEEIYEVMEWSTGSFEVKSPDDVDMGKSSEVQLNFDVVSILMEAARRIDEWISIRKVMPSMSDIYTKTTTFDIDPKDSNQPPVLRTLAKHIDGTYSLSALCHKMLLPRFDVMSHMHALFQGGKIRRLTGNDLVNVAEAHFNLQKIDQGFLILERAAELDPSNLALVEKIADSYNQVGRKKEAARHLENLANNLMQTGDHAQAISIATRCVKADKFNLQMRLLLFTHFLETQKITEAISNARYLSVHFTEKQDWENSINTCNQILNLQPENVEFRAKLIDILLEMDDSPQAMQQCEYLEQYLSKDNIQMIRIYRKVLTRFPHLKQAEERLTTLTRKYRRAKMNRVILIGSILGSAVAGLLVAFMFYDQLDTWLHL